MSNKYIFSNNFGISIPIQEFLRLDDIIQKRIKNNTISLNELNEAINKVRKRK